MVYRVNAVAVQCARLYFCSIHDLLLSLTSVCSTAGPSAMLILISLRCFDFVRSVINEGCGMSTCGMNPSDAWEAKFAVPDATYQ